MTARNILILTALGSALTMPVAAAQTDEEASDATSVDPTQEVVCRRAAPPTGSRIGGRNICHTVAEWAIIDAEAERALRNANASNSFVNGGRPAVGVDPVTGQPNN